jgi:hypothetical protein
MITKEEFDDLCLLTCPHCQRGLPVRFHEPTREFVHDWVGTGQPPPMQQMGYAICWSNGLRNSKYASAQ